MKRKTYGALKSMTDEQLKKYRNEYARKWRAKHKLRVKEYNHRKYLERKENPSNLCFCKYCGSFFASYHKTAVICPYCLKNH